MKFTNTLLLSVACYCFPSAGHVFADSESPVRLWRILTASKALPCSWQPAIDVTSTLPVYLTYANVQPLAGTQCINTTSAEEQLCFGGDSPTRLRLQPDRKVIMGFYSQGFSRIEYVSSLPSPVSDPVFPGFGLFPAVAPGSKAVFNDIQASVRRQYEVAEIRKQTNWMCVLCVPRKSPEASGEKDMEEEPELVEWVILEEESYDRGEPDVARLQYEEQQYYDVPLKPGTCYCQFPTSDDKGQTRGFASDGGEGSASSENGASTNNENQSTQKEGDGCQNANPSESQGTQGHRSESVSTGSQLITATEKKERLDNKRSHPGYDELPPDSKRARTDSLLLSGLPACEPGRLTAETCSPATSPSCQQEQDELEEGEIMEDQPYCTDYMKWLVESLENTGKCPDECKMDNWLAAFHRQDPARATPLSRRWNIARIQRVIQTVRTGEIHPDENRMEGWLEELEKQRSFMAGKLGVCWSYARANRAIQTMEAGNEHPDEKRLSGWLALIRKQGQQRADEFSLRWNAVQAERVIRALEAGNGHPDEKELTGWLIFIRKQDQQRADELSLRWNIVQTGRVIQAMEAGNVHPDEKKLTGWLALMRKQYQQRADEWNLRWSVARAERMIRAMEAGKEHIDEKDLKGWLSLIREQDRQRADELGLRWDVVQTERVIQAMEAGNAHLGEKSLKGWLALIRKQDQQRADELNLRWDAVQAERVIQTMEAGAIHPEEYRVMSWLRMIQRQNPGRAILLRTRWNAARARRQFHPH